jgi:hypothetical protein
MVSPISGSNAPGVNQLAQATTPAPETTATANSSAPKPTTVEPKRDTVELSGAAQAKFLKHQGQTVAQIALQMGLDVKTVNSYVGSAPAHVAPTTTSAPQAQHATAPVPQSYSPAEEATESGAAKAQETIQGKK